LRDAILLFAGAALAWLFQLVYERSRDSHRSKRGADVVEAELHGTHFSPVSFGGFSAHAFDELFAEIADLLPRDLAREVIGYHLRMKYLEEHLADPEKYGGPVHPAWIAAEKDRRDKLVGRLERYASQNEVLLAISRRER